MSILDIVTPDGTFEEITTQCPTCSNFEYVYEKCGQHIKATCRWCGRYIKFVKQYYKRNEDYNMIKPNNFENVNAGDFVPVTLGGHKMVIKKLVESKTKTGKEMLIVYFDFDKSDSQPEYFMDQFKADIRPDKKWPYAGTSYIVTQDNAGNASISLVNFCKSVESSNNGFEVPWGDSWSEQFKGKRIGGIFGEVEDEYNGKVKTRHSLRKFCNYTSAPTAKIPEPKLLDTKRTETKAQATEDYGDLPF